MASATTRALTTAATAVTGLLAGANVDRNLVQMPAWQQVGSEGWAAYSRHADLKRGLVVYPAQAIGGAALTIASAIGLGRDESAPGTATAAASVATALALGGLLATTQAAPAMLSLRSIEDDPAALERAFARFRFWGLVRGVAQILSFGANVWALAALSEHSPSL